jgi:hypothetical protein
MFAVTTKHFFDKHGITEKMDRKTKRVLSSTGAYSRTVMKNGMKTANGSAPPGAYPHSHQGDLKRLIYFGYDDATKSVVVGPTPFKSRESSLTGGLTVPQLVNEGGTVYRQGFVGPRRHRRPAGVRLRYSYQARPFVALTAPIAAKKLAENMAKFDLK